jgi:hypothetical protein
VTDQVGRKGCCQGNDRTSICRPNSCVIIELPASRNSPPTPFSMLYRYPAPHSDPFLSCFANPLLFLQVSLNFPACQQSPTTDRVNDTRTWCEHHILSNLDLVTKLVGGFLGARNDRVRKSNPCNEGTGPHCRRTVHNHHITHYRYSMITPRPGFASRSALLAAKLG